VCTRVGDGGGGFDLKQEVSGVVEMCILDKE